MSIHHGLTVVYGSRAPLEIAVAHLLDDCQIVECSAQNSADIRTAIDAANITPSRTLILFGDAFDLTHVKHDLPMFEQVKLFNYDSRAYGEHTSGVVIFGADEFHQHVLVTGVASLLIEYLLCATTDYKSPLEGVNEQSGQYLLDGMISEPDPFREVVATINGIHGFDIITNFIRSGRAIENYNDKRKCSRILAGIRYEIAAASGKSHKFLAVDDADKLFGETMRISPLENADFIVTYAAHMTNNGEFWRVNIFQANGRLEDIKEIMPQIMSGKQKITPEEMKIIIPPLFT